MSSDSENKLTAGDAGIAGALAAGTSAPLVRADGTQPASAAERERDTRLDRLLMQLDVLVKVRSFRVGDLLALGRGAIVETTHEHTQDVSVRCGSVVLLWAEFEVVDQKLAVRITRVG